MLNKNFLVVLFLISFINYAQQRNVVLIIADDLGKDYCDIYPDHGANVVNLTNVRRLLPRGVVFNNAAADLPLFGFSLKSNGPSILNEKPLSGLSICIEEIPKSANTKLNKPDSYTITSILEKFIFLITKTSSPKPIAANLSLVFGNSIGSTSNANNLPGVCNFFNISALWPPNPSVASNPTSLG